MRESVVLLFIGLLATVTHLTAQEPTAEIVAGFVSPGAELVLLRPYDKEKQQLGPNKAAVLRGSIVSSEAENILFAYMARRLAPWIRRYLWLYCIKPHPDISKCSKSPSMEKFCSLAMLFN